MFKENTIYKQNDLLHMLERDKCMKLEYTLVELEFGFWAEYLNFI